MFTLDFEVGALVFFRAIDPNKLQTTSELQFLTVWKQAPDDYRLSEFGTLDKESVLIGNLRLLFNSAEFQAYLNGKVDQFIKGNHMDKEAVNPSSKGNK